MLFFKFYDPATEKIEYMGHMYVSIKSNLSDLIPELTRRAKLPAKTQVSYNRSSFLKVPILFENPLKKKSACF